MTTASFKSLTLPAVAFLRADSFAPISNGKIWLGVVDGDPTNPSQQVQAYAEQEDGTLVLLSQPIRTNATGYPVLNGAVRKIVVESNYSLLVQDSNGVQQYYFEDVNKYTQDSLKQQLASTQPGEGVSMLGYRAPGEHAADTTQYNVNIQTVSLQDFGEPRAVDDYNGVSGTNSWNALLGIIADYPNGCNIRLPKSLTGTGVYYMAGTGGQADMSKYSLILDEGVSVVHEGSNTPLIAPGLKLNRELKIRMSTLGYTFHIGSTAYGTPAGKPYIMSAGDGERPVIERIITSDVNVMAFNSVNTVTGAQAASPASADGETASFANIPAGNFVVASCPVRPGHELHAMVTMPGSIASVCAYVQTESGWVIFSQPIGGGNISRYVFLEGFSVQSTQFSNPLAANPAYNMDMSDICIKVHSATSFSVLCNHTELVRVDDLTSNIIRAGWGAGLANNTNTAYVAHPVRIRNSKTYGIRPLRVVISGDSTADKINPFSWVNHMQRCVSGVGGIQFSKILNLAVAGQTAVQQASIFSSTDFAALGGFDYALIDVGINDIGGGSSPDAFVAAVVSILNTCLFYNIKAIVGIPAMFYDQGSAAPYGQTGQGTANANRGAPYRLQLMRKLAELGYPVSVLSISDMGAITPALLGMPSLDPVVQDNVHQSAWGGELKGQGWAKSFLGFLFTPVKNVAAKTVKPAWIVSPYGAGAQPKYSIVCNEFSMSGLLDIPASLASGTVLMQLPTAYAPPEQKYFPVVCQDIGGTFLSNTATLRIDVNGTVAALGVPSTARYLFFGNVHYSLMD